MTMKLKMTTEEALALADEWTRDLEVHADSQGWRVVCMVLAGEVRRLRDRVEYLEMEHGQ